MLFIRYPFDLFHLYKFHNILYSIILKLDCKTNFNMMDVVVVGGCIVDLINYIGRFPRPGETMKGAQFCKGFGGKGANQCVMAMQLGAVTGMIAKLGNDTFGREYLQSFKENGINHDFVTLTNADQTSTAAISVTEDSQNSIIYVPGAINHLTSKDILDAEDMIKGSKVLLCTYECPLDTLVTALTIAKKYHVRTVVNAAPTADPSYEKLDPLIDIICLNEVEAEDATHVPVKCVKDAAFAIEKLLYKGCNLVIITLGEKGVVFRHKDQSEHSYVPATKVKAVDSSGAGDAFIGSLVYYLAKHQDLDLETAIKRSCNIASLSVLKKGTQASYPYRKELPDDFFC